ncbi:erythromycin esterase (plasmid) [Bacillus cereus]|nr:erythromycin esterase [Bacillus cereus]
MKRHEEIMNPIERYDGILWLDRITPSQICSIKIMF